MNNRRRWTTWIAVCAIVLGLTACGSGGNGSGSGNAISSPGAPNASSPAESPSEKTTPAIAPQSSAASPESQPASASEPTSEAPASEAPGDELMKQRIRMLERGFGATTPEQAARTWAEARYKRNGAMEYAVLDPATREKELKTFEEMNWVTGVSSPWIARYQIGKGAKQADGSYRFSVKFDYRTSQDAEKKIDWSEIEPDIVTVSKNGENDEFWYVTPQGS